MGAGANIGRGAVGIVTILAAAGMAVAGGPAVGVPSTRPINPEPPVQPAQPATAPAPAVQPSPGQTTPGQPTPGQPAPGQVAPGGAGGQTVRPQTGSAGQPGPGSASGATVPTNVWGTTANLTPEGAETVRLWQDQIRKALVMRGLVRPADAAFSHVATVRRADGTVTPVNSAGMTLEIGAWLSAPREAAPGAAPAPAGSAVEAVAREQLANLKTDAAAAALTGEALDRARSQFATPQGWSELTLSNGDRVFVRGRSMCGGTPVAPAVLQAKLDDAVKRAPLDAEAMRLTGESVTDWANRLRGRWEDCWNPGRSMRPVVGQDEKRLAEQDALRRGLTLEPPEKARFSLRPDAVEVQIELLKGTLPLVRDAGQTERALALSEMVTGAQWRAGVTRLGRAVLAMPPLLGSRTDGDFADLTPETLRGFVRRAVTQAQTSRLAADWAAVAALMVMEERYDDADRMLDRAAQAATTEEDRSAVGLVKERLGQIRPGQ